MKAPEPRSTPTGRSGRTTDRERPAYKDVSAWVIGLVGLLGIAGLLYASTVYAGW